MRVAIVVVNYGSDKLIDSNMGSLPDANVILVDNLKSDVDREAARTLAADRGWHLVEPAGNLGFGGGVNAGVRAAADTGHDAVILLNPDARLDTSAVDAITAALLADPMALISPTILDSHGHPYYRGYAVRLSSGRMTRVDDVQSPPEGTKAWISGACMAFTIALYEQVGGYDESYFLYWEDVDFSVRATHVGAHLRVLTDVTAIHDESGTQETTKGRAKSLLYYRYNTRNRLLFAVRHLPTGALVKWMLQTPRVSYLILLQGGRRQLLQSRKPLWAVARGSLEGLALAAIELTRRCLRR
jgi:GT2 family glycosyltransferase